MAKFTNDAVLDAPGQLIKDTISGMVACSAQPTTYAEATSTYALADVAMASGDITLANGDTSGRKFTVAAKSAVTIDATGDATHVALVDVTNTRVLAVTTCTTLSLTAGGGNTVGFPAWDGEFSDPS